MTTIPSFIPVAERLAALADKIRADMEGKALNAVIVGWVVCFTLCYLVRICYALEARAVAAAGKEIGTVMAGVCGKPASGQAVPRFRLVVSRADDVTAEASPLDRREVEGGPPRPERVGWAWTAPWPGLSWRPASTAGPPKNEGFAASTLARPFRYDYGMNKGFRRLPLPLRERAGVRGEAPICEMESNPSPDPSLKGSGGRKLSRTPWRWFRRPGPGEWRLRSPWSIR